MGDLISRQALCEYALNQKNKSVTPNDIMRFPSTQPEPCEDDPRADVYYLAEKIGIHQLYALVVQLRGEPEPCEDAISRQAAIEAVRCSVSLDRAFGYGHAVDALRELPSAQPEPTAGDCWGCNCPKMNTEPRITFETLQNACKYRRVYSIKGREHKYVGCFYEVEVDECKKEKCPLINQRDTEEL